MGRIDFGTTILFVAHINLGLSDLITSKPSSSLACL